VHEKQVDIAATDGTVIDLDAPGGSSTPFVTVPRDASIEDPTRASAAAS
jgi:hypothetical protein